MNKLTRILGLLLAITLLSLLFYQKKINLKDLNIFLTSPNLLLTCILIWFFYACILVTTRWALLLRFFGYNLPFFVLLKIQMIALFASTFTPGSLGADVIKGLHLKREFNHLTAKQMIKILLLDRLIGLLSLTLIMGIGGTLSINYLWEHSLLVYLYIGIVALCLSGCVLPRMAFSRKLLPERIQKEEEQKLSLLIGSMGASTLLHICAFTHFNLIFLALTPVHIPLTLSSYVFGLGSLGSMVPITPQGIGTVHWIMEWGYSIFNQGEGAQAFNLFLTCQLVFTGLLGGIIALITTEKFAVTPGKIKIRK